MFSENDVYINLEVCKRCPNFCRIHTVSSRLKMVICGDEDLKRMVVLSYPVPMWCSCLLEHSLIEWNENRETDG